MEHEYVIVTLRIPSVGFEEDFELPANLPAERLSQLLLEALAQQQPRRFGAWKGLKMRSGGQKLRNGDTLWTQGIWDGSILMIEEEVR